MSIVNTMQGKKLYCVALFMALNYFSSSTCMNNALSRVNSDASALAIDARYSLAIVALKQSCVSYLTKCLEDYKKQPIVLNDLAGKTAEITGLMIGRGVLQSIKDDRDNGFAHVAVTKQDRVAVKWLCKNQSFLFLKNNKDNQSPLGICLDQLEPNQLIDRKKNALVMMSCVVKSLGKHVKDVYDIEKNNHLRKIIDLKVMYSCLGDCCSDGFKFVCDDELLCCLMSQTQRCNARQILDTFYKEAADKIDSALVLHKFVEEQKVEELFDFLGKNSAMFKSLALQKNSKGMAPVDIAQDYYSSCLNNIESIGFADENFKKARCCLFMLLNYMRLNNGKKKGVSLFCCDKHLVFESDERSSVSSYDFY